MLEANRRQEALEGCRFFMRTQEHARRHARDDFAAPGLKWDWEITHDGNRAYGTWLHQKEQMHNNASYANIIWGYYEFTRDRDYLRQFYPLLRGMAEFFLANVVQETARGYEVRALVDVTERVGRVKNEGLNLSGTIRVLQLAARAATDLALDKDFAARCRRVADGLLVTLDRLYNGHYFMAAEGDPQLNLSSLAPIYPMLIVPPDDPRAISTARAYLRREQRPPMGQGPDRAAAANVTSPWSAGVLATVFAMQGDGESAWETLCAAAPSVCEFGGMSEYILDGGRWNMQYFGTAQAAVCTAVHALLLQARDSRLLLFPAIPPAWPACSFANLLAGGCEVSGRFDRAAGQARAEIMNRSVEPLTTTVCYGRQSLELDLRPGERRTLTWAIA